MHYIVYDLEFNQDLPEVQESATVSSMITADNPQTKVNPAISPVDTSVEEIAPVKRMPFEILQIGAL